MDKEEKSKNKKPRLSSVTVTDSDCICTYEDLKVFEVTPKTEEQIKIIESLRENPRIDFWSSTNLAEPVNVVVPTEFQVNFAAILTKNKIPHKIAIDDVKGLLEKDQFHQVGLPATISGRLNFHKYHRYAEIQSYLTHVAKTYPRLVSLKKYGVSYEKRNLNFVLISKSDGKENKPGIFINAGIHAREWISPAFALYIIHQLVENPQNERLLENVDWFVNPLANPDGYEYTHTTYRFWRKTRSKGESSIGVDMNRNFDFHWSGKGYYSEENSNNYSGPKPNSEPETVCLTKVLTKYSHKIKLFIDIHSAAKSILYPWAYTRAAPENVEELREIALKVRNAVRSVNGTIYKVGGVANMLKNLYGNSTDWARGVAGINWSYVIELPPGDVQQFVLPEKRILEVVREVFEGLRVFHSHVENKYVNEN